MKNLRKRNVRFDLPADLVNAIEGIDFAAYAHKPGVIPFYKKESKIGELRSDCVKFIHELLKYKSYRLNDNSMTWNKSKSSKYFKEVYGRNYFSIITCLRDAGIIQCDDHMIPKKENYGYRISPKFFNTVDDVKNISYTWSYPEKDNSIVPNYSYYIDTPLLSNLTSYNNLLQSLTIHICGAKLVTQHNAIDYQYFNSLYKGLVIDREAILKAAEKDGLVYVVQNSGYAVQNSLDFEASCEAMLNLKDFAYLDFNELSDDMIFRVEDCIIGREYSIKATTLKEKIYQVAYAEASLILYNDSFYIDNVVSFIEHKVSALHLHYTSVINNLINQDYKLSKSDKNGRLNSVFTNMKSTIMEVIKKDNDLVELDLRNSQFAILANWMKSVGLVKKFPDVAKFYDLATGGVLYQEIIAGTQMEKSVMKQEMFGIMFSSEKNNTAGKKKITKMFQNVIDFVDDYKVRNGYKSFPVQLQKTEAEIFIDNILYRIQALSLFAITKHDSVICRREDSEQIFMLMKTYLNQINFEATVCIDGDCVTIGDTTNSGVLDILNQDENNPEYKHPVGDIEVDNGDLNSNSTSKEEDYFSKLETEWQQKSDKRIPLWRRA